MTQPIVKTLIDEQLDDLERKIAHLGFNLPFNEVIGKPREMLVNDLPKRLAPTQKGKRITARVRL